MGPSGPRQSVRRKGAARAKTRNSPSREAASGVESRLARQKEKSSRSCGCEWTSAASTRPNVRLKRTRIGRSSPRRCDDGRDHAFGDWRRARLKSRRSLRRKAPSPAHLELAGLKGSRRKRTGRKGRQRRESQAADERSRAFLSLCSLAAARRPSPQPHLRFDRTIQLKSRDRVADWSGGEKRPPCCAGATVAGARAQDGPRFPDSAPYCRESGTCSLFAPYVVAGGFAPSANVIGWERRPCEFY